MPGSCALTGSDTAQNERFGIYGIPEGEEQHDNIPEIWEYEVCIPKPRILVPWLLCRHGREGHKSKKTYIANQLKIDKENDQLSLFDPNDPFTGSK